MCVVSSDGSVEKSSKIGSSKRDPLSRMSVLIEIEDTVEIVDDVLVSEVTTVVGTCSEGEDTVGGGDGDEGVAVAETDTDTVAVGVREGDEDEE
jgi:hypothetical protein